jgi:hypothetical protein
MNPAAPLSRSVSGKHLSFRSNLHGIAGTRRYVRRLSKRLSFGSRLYADECESNHILGEGQFGFDYAKERLKKRQMFLRSYHFTTDAEEASSISSDTVSEKVEGFLFKIRAALWTVMACNPPAL